MSEQIHNLSIIVLIFMKTLCIAITRIGSLKPLEMNSFVLSGLDAFSICVSRMNQIFTFLTSFRVIQILGTNPFTFNRTFRPYENLCMKIYSILNVAFCVVSLAVFYYERNLYLRSHLNLMGNVVSLVQLLAVKISHLVIVSEAFYQRKLMVEFCEGLIEIDEMMENIGVQIRHKKQKRINSIILGLFSVFVFAFASTSSCLKWIFEGDEMLLFSISFHLPFTVLSFRYFALFSFIWMIKARKEIINDELSTIVLNNDDFFNFKPSKQITTLSLTVIFKNCRQQTRKESIKNFDKLICLRNIHSKVYKLSVLLNYSFGLSNLVNMSNDFVLITSQIYFIFVLLLKSSFDFKVVVDLAICLCYCLPSFLNISILCTICHLTHLTVSELSWNFLFPLELNFLSLTVHQNCASTA